ncbi:hypothetical protein ZYGM_002729 [Zygosaccharomyces mellis]|uniref:GATA-type domain-containing protein n=1 Tax=Zygosaccharomyces mellis TaxID=42258 RepID=A0A4C2E490_9SACH|nr:hypothetical protein ZYGM_002729 [Zygosaccharomyces mellis]
MTGSTAAASFVSEPRVDEKPNGSNGNNSDVSFVNGSVHGSVNASTNTNVSCSTTDASPASSSDAPSPSPSPSTGAPQSKPKAGSANANANMNTSMGVNGNAGNHNTVCKNCFTVTTPLWRRDENGAVLCNACGLFLKLHGRPRPISLKTDVIKSRNRKGNHSHSQNQNPGQSQQTQNQNHTPPSPRGTPSGDDKKRRSDDFSKLKTKKVKTEAKEPQLEGSEITKAANTLGNINRGGNGVGSPNVSAASASRQLPHLSALLGEVSPPPQVQSVHPPQCLQRGNSPLPPPVAILDSTRSTVSSPSVLPHNPKAFQMSSINDVLSPANSFPPPPPQPQQQQQQQQQQQPSSTFTDVRGHLSPPPHQQYHQPQPTLLPLALPGVHSPQPNQQQQQQSQPVLETQLRNEEEIIRLRARINELELVTDLYKRHIFELDEKCKSLQDGVDQIKHRQEQQQQQQQQQQQHNQ